MIHPLATTSTPAPAHAPPLRTIWIADARWMVARRKRRAGAATRYRGLHWRGRWIKNSLGLCVSNRLGAAKERGVLDGGSAGFGQRFGSFKTPPASPICRLQNPFWRTEQLKDTYFGQYSLLSLFPAVDSTLHSACWAASTLDRTSLGADPFRDVWGRR